MQTVYLGPLNEERIKQPEEELEKRDEKLNIVIQQKDGE